MLTICFYQDTRHEKPLFWIRGQLGIGYISRRNDGITELRINGYKQVSDILKELSPFIRFKKKQADAIIGATPILMKAVRNDRDKRKLVDKILIVQSENYATRRKRSKEELLKILGLTP